MRTVSSKSVVTRRLATAVILPGLLTSSLVVAIPAGADSGICNGVVNQLAHRGTVQENLLKAAAKKNADAIAKLQAERAALQSTAAALSDQIAAADKAVADLESQERALAQQTETAASELATLTSEQAA
jgi:septal ring factor EnvC (AmiA/AmiB activator)